MKRSLKIFAVLLLLLGAYLYVYPKIMAMFVSSYAVEYGELKITDRAEVCFVRDEKVYTAQRSGKANYYIADGTLVRRGTKVMDLPETAGAGSYGGFTEVLARLGENIESTGDFTATQGGIVSYFLDGYEGSITPGNMDKLTYEAFMGLKGKRPLGLYREQVRKGEPVYKIVDRTKWYLVCFTDKESVSRYKEGQTVRVEFEDDSVDAEVIAAEIRDRKLRIILETDAYYGSFCKERTGEAFLTTHDEKGLIINNRSIAEVSGQRGVYVRNRAGDYKFVPVKVYLTDGERSLIADRFFYDDEGETVYTVKIYDEILKDAG